MKVYELEGQRVLEWPADGPAMGNGEDAIEILGVAMAEGADVVIIPAARLTPDFFRLRTGLAGAFLQKFQNYRRRVAIIGDISAEVEASPALRDFVRESNGVGQVLFLDSAEALSKRL